MRTYAAEIAAKLQGAHRARTTGEDTQMAENIWETEIDKALALITAVVRNASGDPQSTAVSAERVVELERQLAQTVADRDRLQALADKTAITAANRALSPDSRARVDELERKLADALVRAEQAEESYRQVVEQGNLRADELEQQLVGERKRAEAAEGAAREVAAELATAYVLREVPWTDVTAGDMTVSKTAGVWMVRSVVPPLWTLQQGVEMFDKVPDKGETVAVLVPYVTPEQAEALVREQLGGAAVA